VLDPDPSDEMLAAHVARGDVAAFATLYDRYAHRVYAWASHVVGSTEAEDVVQEVFARLWNKAAQFDANRGRFAWWFGAVVRHHLVAQLRRRTLQQRILAADEIDRVLGQVLEAVDSDFNTLLELGFRTSIQKEWEWRVSRGESLKNLQAFQHLIDDEGDNGAEPTASG
jgi:RNA polymerase sigma factor (sigma-70 family)